MPKEIKKIDMPKPVGISKTSYSTFNYLKIASMDKTSALDNTIDVTTATPSWYHPALTPPNWLLPRSLIEVQNWANIFYNNEPLVQSIINLYSEYPLSKFDLVVEDDKIKREYEDMMFNADFDLYSFIKQMSLQYWKLGEAICYGSYNVNDKRWDRFILLENSSVEVKINKINGKLRFFLLPTDALKSLIRSTDEQDIEYVNSLNPEFVEAIRQNKPVELPPECTSIIARIVRPGDTRGTPICAAIFKILMLQDRLKVAQMAIADRHITPIQLWKIGSVAQGYIPTDKDLENFREMLNQASLDPSFSIIFHDAVQFEAVGIKDKIIPLQPEFEYIDEKIMQCFGVNKAIITGEGPAFTSPQLIGLQIFVNRCLAWRDEIENWIRNHFCRRVAIDRGYKDTRYDPPRLILPQIAWYKDPLLEDFREKEQFYKLWKDGAISTKTLFSKYKTLDWDTEKRNLEEEKGTIFDSHDRLPKAFSTGVPGKVSPPVGEETFVKETPTEEMTVKPIEETETAPEGASEASE